MLIKFIEDWKNAIDNKHIVGTIFMDLSKAFDCLPHGLLIAKLHAYGLSNQACELLADYLSERKQRVKMGNSRSSWNPLCKGVPQGSILGPLFFNIFMNDIFYFIEKCGLYNYADDNSLMNTSPSKDVVIKNLKHDCDISITWFKNNGMSANQSKFQFMLWSSQGIEACEFEIDSETKTLARSVPKLVSK